MYLVCLGYAFPGSAASRGRAFAWAEEYISAPPEPAAAEIIISSLTSGMSGGLEMVGRVRM